MPKPAAWMPRTPFMARCAPPRNAAFGWLEQAYRERSGWLVFLKHDPLAEKMRMDHGSDGSNGS
jgi:hypothetical protein